MANSIKTSLGALFGCIFHLISNRVRKALPVELCFVPGSGSVCHLEICVPISCDCEDPVYVSGPRPQSELAEMMSQSHVLVLPSIEDGFGMVMTQAMSCGCPVISSVNTGGPDLYNDGKEGLIVPIRSPEAILHSLQRLADDPSLRQSMSEPSLRRVHSFGGWHQYGENYSNFLRALCGCA